MGPELGNYYGYHREWDLLMTSAMNSISVERSIPFEELVNCPGIRGDIMNLMMQLSSMPYKKYDTKPEDIVATMNQLKTYPSFIILHP